LNDSSIYRAYSQQDRNERLQNADARLHVLGRNRPRSWKDVILFGEQFEHAVKIPGQQVFTTYLTHAGKVIDLLQREK